MRNIRFIVSPSQLQLGQSISQQLEIPIVNVHIGKHFNSETKIQIKESIRNTDIYFLGSCSSDEMNSINDYLMELFLIIDACRRSNANSITVILPYYPYSRADKKDDGRTPIGGALIARLIEFLKANRILSMDLHSSQIQGFTTLSFDNLSAKKILVKFMNDNYFHSPNSIEQLNSSYILVAPDSGAVKRVESYANELGLNYVIMHKQRDYSQQSVVLKSTLIGSVDNIENKTAIIIDDIIDTMGTMVSAVNELSLKGIKSVIVVATHGVLSGKAIERINQTNLITEVVVTNTIPQTLNQKMCSKLRVVDVSELLCDVIRRLDSGDSISILFK